MVYDKLKDSWIFCPEIWMLAPKSRVALLKQNKFTVMKLGDMGISTTKFTKQQKEVDKN